MNRDLVMHQPPPTVLTLGAGTRLVVALGLAVALWGAVAWALA
ncbi:hypothetical protein [Zavarzinia marina]|nr:hypothetical protein [Zavarzinia marina]